MRLKKSNNKRLYEKNDPVRIKSAEEILSLPSSKKNYFDEDMERFAGKIFYVKQNGDNRIGDDEVILYDINDDESSVSGWIWHVSWVDKLSDKEVKDHLNLVKKELLKKKKEEAKRFKETGVKNIEITREDIKESIEVLSNSSHFNFCVFDGNYTEEYNGDVNLDELEVVTCRDILLGNAGSVYNELGHVSLLFGIDNGYYRKDHITGIVNFINKLEDKLKVERSTFFTVNRLKNVFTVEMSDFWKINPAMFSMFMLLVRVGLFLKKNQSLVSSLKELLSLEPLAAKKLGPRESLPDGMKSTITQFRILYPFLSLLLKFGADKILSLKQDDDLWREIGEYGGDGFGICDLVLPTYTQEDGQIYQLSVFSDKVRDKALHWNLRYSSEVIFFLSNGFIKL